MKNKLISTILAIATAFSVLVTLAGCEEGEYPVEVANLTLESEPENIVILDPSTADIVSYMGYDLKLVGRSTEVTQEWLSVAPEVGSMFDPDVNEIIKLDADLVFAGNGMPLSAKKALEESNITVVTVALAETPTQLKTAYATVGKLLGGSITGASKGAEAYDELIEDMETVKTVVEDARATTIADTVCYLYSKNGQLQLMTSGTYGDMLLNYTGAVNMAVNITEVYPDPNVFKVANPDFLFYDTPETLATIQSDKILGQLSAVKNKKTLMVSEAEMSLQGQSAIATLNKMVTFMYPELGKDNSETPTSDEKTTKPEEATKQPEETTEPTKASTSVADDYKIKLDGLSLKIEDENDNVKAMQQRLYDLGYVDDKENITGYYGTISEAAVKEFQKKNGIKETGKADNATLVKLFDSNAVKAK